MIQMGTSDTIAQATLGKSDAPMENQSSRIPAASLARRLTREPLVHFLFLGTLLFLYFHWKGGTGPGSNRIVITNGEVEHLAAGFVRTWQRQPTQAELDGLIDDYVKEEAATREALAMGLDRNDPIIRRRLRQKLEFVADDSVPENPPSDTQLQAWLDNHPDAFRGEPQVAFQQIYVNASARGAAAKAEADRLLAVLRSGGSRIPIDKIGDASLLPLEQPLAPLSEAARVFGEKFAQKIVMLEPGQWSGPIESSFGLHLVFVQQKVAAVAPKLEEIRPQVEREVMQERRRAQLDAMYQALLKKYSVTIELPAREQANANDRNKDARP
jgi:hypothetical protein